MAEKYSIRAMLACHEFGEVTSSPPLILVHGLFGSGRNWRAFARHFSKTRHVVTVDMRNHGQSFHSGDQSYFDMAGDLQEVITFYGGQADLLGHSMGGKAAMVLALQKPELIGKLLIADIAPVRYAHSQISNVEIMRNLPLDRVNSRAQADEIMAKEISEDAVRAFLLTNLVSQDGHYRWQLNLDAIAQNMQEIIGFPQIDAVSDLEVTFIKGQFSDYVSKAHQPSVFAHFPNAKIIEIENAGHWVHAERQRQFTAEMENWLDKS